MDLLLKFKYLTFFYLCAYNVHSQQNLVCYIQNINANAITNALHAYHNAIRHNLCTSRFLTIVDFSKPSTSKRLWVIDLKKYKVLYSTYVAHGENSGGLYASYFSNKPGSLQSSLGVYTTQNTYNGKFGFSLNLHGLDPTHNSNAYSRRITIHPANFVSESYIRKYGILGKSHGCLALPPSIAPKIISLIKNGSLLYVYHPTLDAR